MAVTNGLSLPIPELTEDADGPKAFSDLANGVEDYVLDRILPAGVTHAPSHFWGSGTTFPLAAAGLRAGDTFFHSTYSCLFTFITGTTWRQAHKPTYANFASLPAASGLYDGFLAFVTSKNTEYRVWNINGTLTWKSAKPFGEIYLAQNWTPGAGDSAPNVWPTVAQYDTDNMWSGLATGNFILPVAGVYRVRFRFAVLASAGLLIARVNKNPTATAPYTGGVIASDGGNVDSTSSDEHRNAVAEVICAAGDRIGAQIYAGMAATIGTGWEGTSLTVEYIGPVPSASNVN